MGDDESDKGTKIVYSCAYVTNELDGGSILKATK